MKKLSFLLATLTVAPVLAQPWQSGLAQALPRAELSANDAQFVGDARVFRAFRPVVHFAGKGEQEPAVAYLKQASSIMRKADGHLVLEPALAEVRKQALDSLHDFDIKRFYKLLPEQEAQVTRRWSFAGEPASDHYSVRAPRDQDFEVRAGGRRRGFGETSGVVRAEPVGEHSERYWVRFRGGIGMGDLPWSSVQRGFEDLLRLFEESFEGEAPFTIQVGESALRKMQPTLGAPDRRLLANAWASFPNIAQHLISVSEIQDVLVDQKRDGVTELALRSRFVLSRIAAIYPDLARYLKQLSDVLAVEVQLVDGAGHTLATFSFDSARLETTLHAFWRDGSLVASQAGKPLPHVKPVYSQLSARVDAEVALRGVRVSVRNFRTRLRYTERAHGASLQLNARDMPEIEVRGAAFGFVPTALVDLFIPGDLKGLATRFYRALTQGNQGRGFAASLVFEHDPESGLTTIEGDAGAEILDNGLLRFALSAMSDRLLPDEKQENDLRRLAIAYRDAFDQDLARFARYGQIPD